MKISFIAKISIVRKKKTFLSVYMYTFHTIVKLQHKIWTSIRMLAQNRDQAIGILTLTHSFTITCTQLHRYRYIYTYVFAYDCMSYLRYNTHPLSHLRVATKSDRKKSIYFDRYEMNATFAFNALVLDICNNNKNNKSTKNVTRITETIMIFSPQSFSFNTPRENRMVNTFYKCPKRELL